jgi:hypothetical protein
MCPKTRRALADLKSAIEAGDIATIERIMASSIKASHKLAGVMYGNADVESANAKPIQTPGGGAEDVIDAEFDVGR